MIEYKRISLDWIGDRFMFTVNNAVYTTRTLEAAIAAVDTVLEVNYIKSAAYEVW